jgi:hypothetical protein
MFSSPSPRQGLGAALGRVIERESQEKSDGIRKRKTAEPCFTTLAELMKYKGVTQ